MRNADIYSLWQSGRSEGLAVASLDMVKSGMFSGVPDKQPFRVDGASVSRLAFCDFYIHRRAR